MRAHGVGYTLRRSLEKLGDRAFHPYDKAWKRMRATPDALEQQRQHPLEAGLISIVIPVYNTRPEFLHELADSLLAQTYPHWQACLYDGMSTKPETLAALETVAARDARIIVRHGATNEGIAGNSNRALEMAEGEWIALCDHDDLLPPETLYRVAETILRDAPDMMYSDEDKITEDGRYHIDPHFKPDFSPDTLRANNYICHLLIARRSLMRAVGGFRTGFDGSQDHDLALRLSEKAKKIVHIPHVLYHWRMVGSSMSHQNLARCVDAGCRAVQEHMNRVGLHGTAEPDGDCIRLRYDVPESLSVRVIIAGERARAEKCRAVFAQSAWKNMTCMVVPEGTCAALDSAVAEAEEDVLLFVDAAVRPQHDDFVKELLMYAQRDDVGVAVPQLICGGRLPSCAAETMGLIRCREAGLPRWVSSWGRLLRISHNTPRVDGRCMMIRRDHFIPFEADQNGRLLADRWTNELTARGLRHVFTPHAQATLTRR